MQSLLQIARKFVKEEHIKNVLNGDWVALHDELGNTLEGIRGRIGVAATIQEGVEIGVDVIEMQPGNAFPLHTHPGDHILYAMEGNGLVHVDGVDHPISEGDTIYIPAEYPHGLRVDNNADPFLFFAFGHPHKHLEARDRMKVVKTKP